MAGELSDFGHWLTLTHTQRWHAQYHDVGMGHLYQGRFKSFPIAVDEHFLHVCRYAERNALRAGLAQRAEAWRWCSLWQRQHKDKLDKWILSPWPVSEPATWLKEVNRSQSEAEWRALRATRPALWVGRLGQTDGAASGSGEHLPAAWPASKDQNSLRKRVLTRSRFAFKSS
jgi:hypothetical protein